MPGTARQLHFTHALERFSARLDELLAGARLERESLSPELLDEIAYTTGELTIVLMNHIGEQREELLKEVLAQAETLRKLLRSKQLEDEQLILAFDPFRQKIERLLSESKLAA